ncbi:MAG: hypothetical protein JNG84_00425 [Archangium sp.]|nr:hypothetical protein [Archangium sp.]
MSLATLVALLLTADELPPERAAAIEAESAKELRAVDAKYGNRKLSELSNDERRALGQEKAEAERKVLEKNGVSVKEWARESAKRSPKESAQVKQAGQQLEKREKDAAAAAKKGGPKEIQVQRGFNDENPVVLEEAGGGAGAGGVTVGAEADAAAARDADEALRGGGNSGDSDDAPKPKSKSKSSRKR